MPQEVPDYLSHSNVVQMTTLVVAAYVGHNRVDEAQIPEVIKSVYASLAELDGRSSAVIEAKQKPAVSIKKSITDDYVICLEDGKKLKMLKRYLRTAYDLSPEDYRAKWGLSSNYPMVAPNYSKQRSVFARKIGLGKSRA